MPGREVLDEMKSEKIIVRKMGVGVPGREVLNEIKSDAIIRRKWGWCPVIGRSL